MGGKYRVTSGEKEKMTMNLQWLEAVSKLLLSLAVIRREKRGCHREKKTQLGFFYGSKNGG
jgi:aspartate oxidase